MLVPETRKMTASSLMLLKFSHEPLPLCQILALLFLLALVVRAANRPAEYDSDDELIAPRQQIRQPLIANRQAVPATGAPVAGTLDQRPPSRNDAWSTRMREKYGLDTAEFTYNPSESQRQVSAQPQEERSRCIIM